MPENAGAQERDDWDDIHELPDVPGVPGDIIGVRISHGWAAAYGYYEIVEIGDGVVHRSYAVEPERAERLVPGILPAPASAQFDDGPLSPLHVILQNVRYCAAGRNDDDTAPLPMTDESTSLRVTYKAFTGEIREVAIHADPEWGTDAGSKAAQSILQYVERAFGNKLTLDGLLVIHRRRQYATVAMNGNLYASTGPNANPVRAIDGENDDLLEITPTMQDGHLCLELRAVDLCSGWKSHKARVEAKDKAVVRLAPSDFTREGTGGDEAALESIPRPGIPEPEEWIVVCATKIYFHEQHIDVASVLPGFELVDSPELYRDPAIQVNEDLSIAGFDHPFPETAELEKLEFDLSSRQPGTVRYFRSITDRLVHRKTQLEETRLYFLTEYLNEDGTSTGRYSFDIEKEHDAHYSFNTEGATRLRRIMDVPLHAPLGPAMVEYLKTHDDQALVRLVWKVKTSSISY